MPGTCCCVPFCSERGGHIFPRDPNLVKKWVIAIRRDKWSPQKSSVVCKNHFQETDYIQTTQCGSKPMQMHLKRGAIPSQFLWMKMEAPSRQARASRLEARLKRAHPEVLIHNLEEVLMEVDVHSENLEETLDDPATPNESSSFQPTTSNAATQTMASFQPTTSHAATQTMASFQPTTSHAATETKSLPHLAIENFAFNDKAVHFYTGLETYSKFNMVLITLGPAAHYLQYRFRQSEVLSIPNQFFLTLIKLRRGKTDFELSLHFEISEFSVSNIFITWINFMYSQWKELDIWPSRELVSFYMPVNFKKMFPATRVILDGVEVPIKKPSAPLAQQATFSTYKNRNTLKTVVGATPGGLVSSIPCAYGGSASDRKLVEIGDLPTKCESKDSIMADKGFDVQDLFATRNIQVNTPTFLRGINQLPGLKLIHDRKISSKRIHIERLIGLSKTYKILQMPLTLHQTQLGSQILFNCFMLCNFRKCIVNRYA